MGECSRVTGHPEQGRVWGGHRLLENELEKMKRSKKWRNMWLYHGPHLNHLNFKPLFPKALTFPLSIPPISPRPCACIASLLQPAKRTRNFRVYSIEGADFRRVQTGRKRWWIVGTICLSSNLDLMAIGHWVSWCLTNESLLRVTNTVANNLKAWWSVDEAEGRPQVAFTNSNLLLQSLTKRSEHRGRDLW